jgi:hypothetical protein
MIDKEIQMMTIPFNRTFNRTIHRAARDIYAATHDDPLFDVMDGATAEATRRAAWFLPPGHTIEVALAGTIFTDILIMTDHAIHAASDSATRDPTYTAADLPAMPQFVLPISTAIDAAIRAGSGSLRSKR